jgi:hypothetical protein
VSLAALVAALPELAGAVKAMPQVAQAIANVFHDLAYSRDPGDSLLHLQIVAAAHGLKLDETRV